MSTNGRPRARFGETEAQRAARLKQYKRDQRLKTVGSILLVVGAVVGVSLLVGAIFALSALLFMFAWNVGVDALVSAAGGEVGDISFTAALAAVIALNFVRSIFSRGTAVNTESK